MAKASSIIEAARIKDRTERVTARAQADAEDITRQNRALIELFIEAGLLRDIIRPSDHSDRGYAQRKALDNHEKLVLNTDLKTAGALQAIGFETYPDANDRDKCVVVFQFGPEQDDVKYEALVRFLARRAAEKTTDHMVESVQTLMERHVLPAISSKRNDLKSIHRYMQEAFPGIILEDNTKEFSARLTELLASSGGMPTPSAPQRVRE